MTTEQHFTVKENGQLVQIPPKDTYTLPNGLVIKTRVVAMGVVDMVLNGGEKPRPPQELVPVYDIHGNEVGKTVETNFANDNYIHRMREYRVERQNKLAEVMCELGTDFTPPQEEIARYKETLLALDPSLKFPASDKVFYLLSMVLTNEDEVRDLIEAIQRRNQPTEAAIAEVTSGF